MVDIVDHQTRSRMMSGIKGKNTKPEIWIRKALHASGFRFRLHRKDLPGSPDVVLPKYHAVILINGCFWHGHDCHLFKWPQTRREFWKDKINGNIARDQKNQAELKLLGWRVCILWECELKGTKEDRRLEAIDTVAKWIVDESSEIHIPHSRTQVTAI
ncbi:very short patch repair endonuclease [Marinobacter sp.]|uniref:very short patch repair endonuclease n=1 Tax=Marinobacter sp. TaxID=50741 RepID=UPI001985A651|nr:very short patch repair endonuclease [Marinobacter sp.]MBC7191937.1 DNA mismatch endonuclease Vsr [Marinobacter sp.]